MAFSRVVSVGNGTATQFTVNFALDYLLETDVTCRVGTEVDGSGDPVYRAITFLSTNLVEVSGTPPGNGIQVVFERTVDKSILRVDYSNGDQLDEDNLMIAQKQAMMAVHEVLDGRFSVMTQDLDMGGFQIKDLAAPTEDTDAVSKVHLDTTLAGLATTVDVEIVQAASAAAISARDAAQSARDIAETARDEAVAAAAIGAKHVDNYGAIGNGTTDDRAAFAAMQSDVDVDDILVRGHKTYLIASNLTLTKDITFAGLSRIVIPDGVTITLSGNLTSDASYIFECVGTGKVVFNKKATQVRVEWWGALISETYTPAQATKNRLALAAVDATGIYCRIPQGTLFTDTTFYQCTSGSFIEGAGEKWETGVKGTRICVVSATDTVIAQGALSLPPDINSYLYQPRLANLNLTRAMAPQPPDAANTGNGAAGLLMRWSLGAQNEHIGCEQHVLGFAISGIVSAKVIDCFANRSIAGTGPNVANDIHWAFFLNGLSGIPAAGGNASLYMLRCRSGGGSPAMIDNVGIVANGKSADTFIDRFEDAGSMVGAFFVGSNTAYGDMDISLAGCRFDTCTRYGVRISGGAGQITMTDCYVACAGSLCTANYAIENFTGSLTGLGLQSIGSVGSANLDGLRIIASSGVNIQFMDAGSPRPVELINSTLCRIAPTIKTDTAVTASTAIPAIWVQNSTKCSITPIIQGPNKYGYGVFVDAPSSKIEVNATAILATPVNGNAVSSNGTPVTAAGAFGTSCLATGIF